MNAQLTRLFAALIATSKPALVRYDLARKDRMRTVEIDALVSVRKHTRRSAGLAATEAAVLPLLLFIGGVNSAAIPVALVAGLASAALFRGRFGAARVLVPLPAAFHHSSWTKPRTYFRDPASGIQRISSSWPQA